MFVHIGVLRSSILMIAFWALQTYAAKLNLESTRLQRENINFTRYEDQETLLSAMCSARIHEKRLVGLFSKLYPLMLILNSALSIAICAMVTDQVATAWILRDNDRDKFLFGLLPALNEDRKPVPHSELIKMSRGFLFLATLAFIMGIIACFFDNTHTHRLASVTVTALKIVAILSLLTFTLVNIPQDMQHNIFAGSFDKINFATGVDHSVSTLFFYAGVLAFSDGVFPLKVSAIASSHKR